MVSARTSSGLAWLTAALAACGPGPAASPLDSRRVGYRADERGARVLAGVEATLVAERDRARLAVSLSAFGPEVEAVPGFEGVRGSNRITARELTRIVEEGALTVRTLDRERDAVFGGSRRVARVGPVSERRLLPDGALELGAATREVYVLELAVDSGSLPAGRYRTELDVGGRTRLAVDFEFRGSTGRIEDIDTHPGPVPEELRP